MLGTAAEDDIPISPWHMPGPLKGIDGDRAGILGAVMSVVVSVVVSVAVRVVGRVEVHKGPHAFVVTH
jgi:hypothetical protein